MTLLVDWSSRETVPIEAIEELVPDWIRERLDWSTVSRELPLFARAFLEGITKPGIKSLEWRKVRSRDMVFRSGSILSFERLSGESYSTKTFRGISPEVLDFFEGVRSRFPSRIDVEPLGRCEVCRRFFISLRGGKRRSRACGKQHQAVLSSRESRNSDTYRAKERLRNRERMAAVREAERLVRQWRRKGMTDKEQANLLWMWNDEKGSILGKKAIFNILKKEN